MSMLGDTLAVQKEVRRIQGEARAALQRLKELERRQRDYEEQVVLQSGTLVEVLQNGATNHEVEAFLRKPYALLRVRAGEALVVVPKFVHGLQIGWLEQETDTYWVYRVNRYSAWLSDVPDDVREVIGAPTGPDVVVEGDYLSFPEGQESQVASALKGHVADVQGGRARIIRGHAFDVLVDLIEQGSLPFRPRPVAAEDLRVPEVDFQLRLYQQEAYDRFLQTGAVGVFFPTGAGKSFVAM